MLPKHNAAHTKESHIIPSQSKTTITIAQLSDCHLFADVNREHHGVNVFNTLNRVLADIASRPEIDCIVFTGDLTQDHTELSYKRFSQAVRDNNISTPVYFLAGNHDEETLLNRYLANAPFVQNKTIHFLNWQVQLLNSKSETPAGNVCSDTLDLLANSIDSTKQQLLMMHHHPVNVGYFIDKHGLENKADFWQAVKALPNIQGIACGHVHRASKINKGTEMAEQCVDVYTCPATSIQFDPLADTVKALDKSPGYRLFYLPQNGTMSSDVIWC